MSALLAVNVLRVTKLLCWLTALTCLEPPDTDKMLQKQHEQNKLALRSYKQQNPEFLKKMNKVHCAQWTADECAQHFTTEYRVSTQGIL